MRGKKHSYARGARAKQEEFIPVLFITLTERNNTSKHTAWRQAERFYQHLSNFTKTHIKAERGYETSGNRHEHAVASVPSSEYNRFWEKFSIFDSSMACGKRWITPEHARELIKKKDSSRFSKSLLHISSFDPDREVNAYRYVLAKHQPVMEEDSKSIYCPRYYSRCRRGRCEHISL
jgi:hypothetical protein